MRITERGSCCSSLASSTCPGFRCALNDVSLVSGDFLSAAHCVDTIHNENIIESAITNSSNVVLSPVDSRLVSNISNSKLENLKKCKQIKFVSWMYLPNQPTPIKIKSDSFLDLIVSANVNYKAKTK